MRPILIAYSCRRSPTHGQVRELASRAEVHSLPEICKTAGYFQLKTTELHALNRSVEILWD